MRETNSHYILDFTSISLWVHTVTQHVLDKLEQADLAQASPLC